jgi:hypothetical protein
MPAYAGMTASLWKRSASGHDDFSVPVNPSLILFVKMAVADAAVHRGSAAYVVRSRVFQRVRRNA